MSREFVGAMHKKTINYQKKILGSDCGLKGKCLLRKDPRYCSKILWSGKSKFNFFQSDVISFKC